MYFSPKEEGFIDYIPVFKLDIDILPSMLLDLVIPEEDLFFYWKENMYATVTTSTGETVVRGIRCVVSATDAQNIYGLLHERDCVDVYPVKIYDLQEGHFIATCWAVETEDAILFDTVSVDDEKYIKKVDIKQTTYFPVSINEKEIIGGSWFCYRFNKEFGEFFDKLPQPVMPRDRSKEDIPLNKKGQKAKGKCIVLNVEKMNKSLPKEKNSMANIIPFHK